MDISREKLSWFLNRGFDLVASNSTGALVCEKLLEKGFDFERLLETKADHLEAKTRGERNTVVELQAGENIFLKQYHHGGLLAGENDVYYDTPDRFLAELKATQVVYEKLTATPRPLGVIFRKTGSGWVGYYFSEFIQTDQFTARLRDNKPGLIKRAGRLLAAVHRLGVDPLDFHAGNLLVTPEDELLAVDFDPVRFSSPGSFRSAFRINRFVRSLQKNGIHFAGGKFRRGYFSEVEKGRLIRISDKIQRPVWFLKNMISDLIYYFQTPDLRSEEVEKILVRAPNWLGDAVMSLPFFQDLKKSRPAVEVDVVCRSSEAEIYRRTPVVCRVHVLEAKSFRLPQKIKKENYSHLVVLPKSLRTGLQAFFSGIPRRIGFATQGRGVFLTDPVDLDGRHRRVHHSRLFYYAAGGLVDLPEEVPDPELEKPTLPAGYPGLNPEENYVTIHPGSAYGPAKRWPAAEFSKFLDLLVEEFGYKIVAVGVENERALASEIFSGLPGSKTINLAGRTDLAECMQLLAYSRLAVANDSGIMHLAAALKTPTVGLFGSTSPELTAPLGPRTRVLYSGLECSPCFEKKCPLEDGRYQCLEKISPGRVFEAALELLGEVDNG